MPTPDPIVPAKSPFARHPVLAIAGGWLLIWGAFEIALRMLPPGMLRFTVEARKVHRYSPRWKVDLIPGRVAHLFLPAPDGHFLYNFLVTTGPDGFRTFDRPMDQPGADSASDGRASTRFIHAIGDSYTMGWGGDYTSSYPAQMDWMLPPGWRVLNLGLDGFGAIAATEKSMQLWARFPATHAVYLFSPNDFEDDERVVRLRQRGRLYHLSCLGFDWLRRHTYTANVPTALKWYAYFGENRRRRDTATEKTISRALATPETLLVEPEAAELPAPDPAHPSLRALRAYADFTRRHGAGLTVVVVSGGESSLRTYRHCRENGLDACLVAFPEACQLRRDGHLNQAGNYALSLLLCRRLALPDGCD